MLYCMISQTFRTGLSARISYRHKSGSLFNILYISYTQFISHDNNKKIKFTLQINIYLMFSYLSRVYSLVGA